MTRLAAVIAASAGVSVYVVLAYNQHRAPTITHLVHEARLHFRPACPQCGVKVLGSRRPRYRGFLR